MKPGDTRIEILIGRVLRGGVLVSTLCISVGLLVALIQPQGATWLLELGILLLIATPAARVVLSIVEYAIARDWTFLVLTSIVLVELIAGAVAALVFHRKI